MHKYILSDVPEFMNVLRESEEKGIKSNSMKVDNGDRFNSYRIITYIKGMTDGLYGLCRSVIVNDVNKVICFAPPKSVPASLFINYSIDSVIAEEFVEGTMINMFWDNTFQSERWEIATRNIVGAKTTFYKSYETKSKTFRTMFFEAMEYCNLNFSDLDKNYCYSFVLQHPENRIVIPFKNPQLYLVGVFKINHVENVITVDNIPYENIHKNWPSDCTVKIPTRYSFTSFTELVETYASMNTRYDIMGVVLHNRETGSRTKIRNPVYEEVRQLKGNQPKLQYQYLSLRKDGKVSEFLKYFPENKKIFSQFREQVHLFTKTLYENYILCFIKKEKKLVDYSDQYRTHMFHLHQQYLTELKEKGLYVNNTVVQKYVNQLHSSLLMFCLNYHMRQRNVDSLL